MKAFILALAVLFSAVAHAGPVERACLSAGADGATTAIGLAQGAVEINPIAPESIGGIVAFVAVKCGAMYAIGELSDEPHRTYRLTQIEAMWGAAAVANLSGAVIYAALGDAMLANAGGLVLGALYGVWRWQSTEPEREQARVNTIVAKMCADGRARNPAFTCPAGM